MNDQLFFKVLVPRNVKCMALGCMALTGGGHSPPVAGKSPFHAPVPSWWGAGLASLAHPFGVWGGGGSGNSISPA